jgi:hypothetical protein
VCPAVRYCNTSHRFAITISGERSATMDSQVPPPKPPPNLPPTSPPPSQASAAHSKTLNIFHRPRGCRRVSQPGRLLRQAGASVWRRRGAHFTRRRCLPCELQRLYWQLRAFAVGAAQLRARRGRRRLLHMSSSEHSPPPTPPSLDKFQRLVIVIVHALAAISVLQIFRFSH